MSELLQKLQAADDERIFAVAESLRRGVSLEQIHQVTGIDLFFLDSIARIVNLEMRLEQKKEWKKEDWLLAKKNGFSDLELAYFKGVSEEEVRQERQRLGVLPVYRIVDTYAGEVETTTPYYYSSYGEEDEFEQANKPRVVV